MINLNDYYFHFTNGSIRDENEISFSLKNLNDILKSGYILSRAKQIEHLGFYNEGFKSANWNGNEYISICQIGSNINDEFLDEDENAFSLFSDNHGICLILNKDLLYESLRRKYYWHMQGEIQVKDQISSKYFEAIGIKLSDYFISNAINDKNALKDKLKKDKETISRIKKLLDDNNYNLPIFCLNNGEEATKYLAKIKTL